MALADLTALAPEEIAARLAGPPEARAAFVRAAAEAGLAEAQAIYGQMCLDRGDAPEGLDWFVRAAAQHHVMAINMVGRCYDLGWGTAVDKARAAECYRIAAGAGLDWGMYNYATLLTLGHGVAADKAAALGWFRKAATLGHGLAAAKAINFVGSFYEDGWVVPRNLGHAAHCYARAAQGGDFRGAFNHARMLAQAGRIAEALGWLSRTAQTATPEFIEQAANWLARCDIPTLRARGAQALHARKIPAGLRKTT